MWAYLGKSFFTINFILCKFVFKKSKSYLGPIQWLKWDSLMKKNKGKNLVRLSLCMKEHLIVFVRKLGNEKTLT